MSLETLIDDGEAHVVIPHRPDWSVKPRRSRHWLNRVAGATTGAEDRISLRPAPLIELSYQVDPWDEIERAQLVERILAAAKSGLAVVPYWGRGTQLAADASANQIPIEHTLWPWRPEDRLLIGRPARHDWQIWETAQIDEISAGLILLVDPLTHTYPPGAFCWPLMFGKFDRGKMRVWNESHGSIAITITQRRPFLAAPLIDITLCAVGELMVSEHILAGGGDTFDCYEDTDQIDETLPLAGSGFDGPWVVGDALLKHVFGDDFEAYLVSDNEPTTLNAGTGFETPWTVSPRDPEEWVATARWPIWWLEARFISGLNDNDPVGSWIDKAMDQHATFHLPAHYPIYKTGIINDLPAVRWDGTRRLSCPVTDKFRLASGRTIVFVLAWDPAPTTNRSMSSALTAAGPGNRAHTRSVGDKWSAGGRRLDTDGFAEGISSVSIDTAWHVFIASFDWENARLNVYLDGSVIATVDPFQTVGTTPDTDSNQIWIGDATVGFQGDIAAHQIFPFAFSSADVAAVTSHFQSIYNL